MMDVIERMQRFVGIAAQDRRLSTRHVVVYLSLCVLQSQRMDESFCISRRQVMSCCKIRGIATYHKCMRELHGFGYIQYVPSYHPIRGSSVKLSDFESVLFK